MGSRMKYLILLLLPMQAMAHGYHYSAPSTINNVTNINNYQCGSSAIASASGQHNYKATNQLQWSAAGAYLSGTCDSSAVSFGLSKQFGKVFSAVNYSTDGSDSAIGFSFSGTF